MIATKLPLVTEFTSTGTGEKYAYHTENMTRLSRGEVPGPILTHIMPTGRCQHVCGYCSVSTRDTSLSLPFSTITGYLDILCPLNLKAVILSGGGNPILYKCKETGKDLNDVIDECHKRGLEVGLITNGMPLKEHPDGRKSWKTIRPETLDKCTWIRISMSGLDHPEKEVFVPDLDQTKTTLGFSYIFHDLYQEPEDKNHGQVSTLLDLKHELKDGEAVYGKDRLPWLEKEFKFYVDKYKPRYFRLLCNCLEPDKIPERHKILTEVANRVDPNILFSQNKPPCAPEKCFLGYIHPVLCEDSYIRPCDSVSLTTADIAYKEGRSEHKFGNPWIVCHWSEIGDLYKQPLHSLVDSKKWCGGCVFSHQNSMLIKVSGGFMPPMPNSKPLHVNFV